MTDHAILEPLIRPQGCLLMKKAADAYSLTHYLGPGLTLGEVPEDGRTVLSCRTLRVSPAFSSIRVLFRFFPGALPASRSSRYRRGPRRDGCAPVCVGGSSPPCDLRIIFKSKQPCAGQNGSGKPSGSLYLCCGWMDSHEERARPLYAHAARGRLRLVVDRVAAAMRGFSPSLAGFGQGTSLDFDLSLTPSPRLVVAFAPTAGARRDSRF